MNYLKNLLGIAVAGGWCGSGVADALTPWSKKEVMQFMEKMYSYDPMTFELHYFLKKSGAPLIRKQGSCCIFSHDQNFPEKMCSFLRLFFVDEVFEKKKEKFGAIRSTKPLPVLGAEDISSVTRVEDIPCLTLPPRSSWNRAKVEVFRRQQ